MTGVEKITARILTDAKEEARAILEAAREDCQRISEEYTHLAESRREEMEEAVIKEGEEWIARARVNAEDTEREILGNAKDKVLAETFAAAKAELFDTDYGKYRELLTALLTGALLAQAKWEKEQIIIGAPVVCERYEVSLGAADCTRFGQDILRGAKKVTERRIGKERTEKLCLARTPAEIEGGVILRCGDQVYDRSTKALLQEAGEALEEKLEKLLFG